MAEWNHNGSSWVATCLLILETLSSYDMICDKVTYVILLFGLLLVLSANWFIVYKQYKHFIISLSIYHYHCNYIINSLIEPSQSGDDSEEVVDSEEEVMVEKVEEEMEVEVVEKEEVVVVEKEKEVAVSSN